MASSTSYSACDAIPDRVPDSHPTDRLARIIEQFNAMDPGPVRDDMERVISGMTHALTHPPMMAPHMPWDTVMIQVGSPVNREAMNNATSIAMADHMTDCIKWHSAVIKVFELVQAQLNIDPFKNEPECRVIYEEILMQGLHRLRDVSGKGYRR